MQGIYCMHGTCMEMYSAHPLFHHWRVKFCSQWKTLQTQLLYTKPMLQDWSKVNVQVLKSPKQTLSVSQNRKK